MTTAQEKINQYRKGHSAPIQYKASQSQRKAVVNEDSRTIEFYFAVWGVKDLNGEKSMKGCVTKSIQEHGPKSKSPQKIAFLKQHNQSEPLGRILSIEEDDYGAKAIAEFDNIPLANDVLEQVRSGTYNQFSYGYKYIWDRVEWDEMDDSLVLKEVQMFEISVVTIGANADTKLIGFKSLNLEDAFEELSTETELFIKSLDSTKQLHARSIISKHIALSLKEPSQKTPLPTTPRSVNIKEAINNFKF